MPSDLVLWKNINNFWLKKHYAWNHVQLNTFYKILSYALPTALDKMHFLIQKYWYFSYFSTKTYAVSTH